MAVSGRLVDHPLLSHFCLYLSNFVSFYLYLKIIWILSYLNIFLSGATWGVYGYYNFFSLPLFFFNKAHLLMPLQTQGLTILRFPKRIRASSLFFNVKTQNSWAELLCFGRNVPSDLQFALGLVLSVSLLHLFPVLCLLFLLNVLQMNSGNLTLWALWPVQSSVYGYMRTSHKSQHS